MPTVSRSARGVAALDAALLRQQTLEAELEVAKAEVRRLEEVELPAAFTEDGLSELSLPSGLRARRDLTVQGSFPLPTADRPDAMQRHAAARDWMISNGHADSLRAVVTANYGAGEREEALATYEWLRGHNSATTTMVETVHHSTLRGIIRDRVSRGVATPVEELGCVIIRKVKLTTPPRRRSTPIIPEE